LRNQSKKVRVVCCETVCLSLIAAALVYVPKVRKANYTTIFDPLQEKYGNRTGGLLFIPELLGDLFWEAAILAALGCNSV